MKALKRACLLALSFIAAPSLAHAELLPPVKVDAGVGFHFNSHVGQSKFGCVAGPWYTYFPYNAYFQSPAPVYGWPYFPSAAAVPAPPPQTGPRMPQTPQQNNQSMYYQSRDIQPVNYQAPAPSYWYGR
jgi:hypothetical protein